MMAEKLADAVRGRPPLPRADVPYYVAEAALIQKETIKDQRLRA